MALVWNVSPELLHVGPIVFRWYGILFALSFALGFHLTKSMFIREKRPLIYVDYLIFYMMVATVIGARLGHTLFYEPSIYLADPIRILYIWEGGLASHGAAIGIFAALWFFCKRNPQFSFLWVVDRLCIGVAGAGVLIRTGNFFNSEIIGKPTHSDWGVIFSRIDQLPRHPAQLYEAFCYFLIFLWLYRLYWKTDWYKVPGFIIGNFLVLVFGARFVLEFFKENQVAFESGLPLNLGQLFSIPLVLIGGYLILRGWRLDKNGSAKAPASSKASRR